MRAQLVIEYISYGLFTLSGAMSYAYVYDVEPLTAEKHYVIERDAYNRSRDFCFNDFPSFDRWLDEQAERDNRMKEWFAAVAQDIGQQSADAFSWGYGSNIDASIPMSAEQWKVAYGD